MSDPAKLSEDERAAIDRTARDMANASVLARLTRLVRDWEKEEAAKRRTALAVLALIPVALALAAFWLFF